MREERRDNTLKMGFLEFGSFQEDVLCCPYTRRGLPVLVRQAKKNLMCKEGKKQYQKKSQTLVGRHGNENRLVIGDKYIKNHCRNFL